MKRTKPKHDDASLKAHCESTRLSRAGAITWRALIGISVLGTGIAAPMLRDAGRLTVGTSLLKGVGTFGDVVGGIEGIGDVCGWIGTSLGSHFTTVLSAALEVGAALGPVAVTCWIVCLFGALRRVMVQGLAHLDLAYLEKHLSKLSPDTQVRRSSGIDGAHFFLGPEAIWASPERLWIQVRFLSWRRQSHLMVLTAQFSRIDVADASTYDLRLFTRAARRVWLSAKEVELVAAVVARARDLIEWPDSSAGDDDGGLGDRPSPDTPPVARKDTSDLRRH